MQRLLQEYVTEKKIAGAVAVIGTKRRPRVFCSGRIAFEEDAASADPDSLWRIYSMTKLITGVAAMQLIEDGKIELDTPVQTIFPTFAESRVLVDGNSLETRRARTAITVRHLMTHTSGFVGSMVPEPPLSTFYLDRKLNVSRVSIEQDSKVQHQTSLLAFASAAGTVPLAFDPGSQWSYGISSDVLGAVVEKVSGVPFAQFLQRKIFDPLEMQETGFTVAPEKLNRLATTYEVTSDGIRSIDAPPASIFAIPPPFPYPSSGLVSSARDFARFAEMLLGEGALRGTRVLASSTARLMMSNLLPTGISALGGGWGAGGLVLLSPARAPAPLGRNPGTYGWQGAAGTVCWVDRTTGVYALLMTQYLPSHAYELHSQFTDAVFETKSALGPA